MSGGGGGAGNSGGSGGNTNASARAAMTSNTAYSGSGISGASAGPAGGQSSGGNYSSGIKETEQEILVVAMTIENSIVLLVNIKIHLKI
jgi:hypothetical protein